MTYHLRCHLHRFGQDSLLSVNELKVSFSRLVVPCGCRCWGCLLTLSGIVCSFSQNSSHWEWMGKAVRLASDSIATRCWVAIGLLRDWQVTWGMLFDCDCLLFFCQEWGP